MARYARQGLAQEARERIGQQSCRNTRRQYMRSVERFFSWMHAQDRTSAKDFRAAPVETLNRYSRWLQQSGCSPATVHTYLAGPCAVFAVPMASIGKPKRSAGTISRSRGCGNARGQNEAALQKYARVVAFQRATGIRRAELARLRGSDYVRDAAGHPCVLVRKGKGGKRQLQRILPADEAFVASCFDGSEAPVFARAELNNKIDLHGMRAAHAREVYAYYLAAAQTSAGRRQLQEELRSSFAEGNPKAGARKCRRFEKEITDESPRLLRGENSVRAADEGMPQAYDRLALMCVSVWHLSHWRNDVTVTNYML